MTFEGKKVVIFLNNPREGEPKFFFGICLKETDLTIKILDDRTNAEKEFSKLHIRTEEKR